MGGADSRQEVHAALSLEALQARHCEMLRAIETSSEVEGGGVVGDAKALPSGHQVEDDNSPPIPSATGPGKANGQGEDAEREPSPDGDEEAAQAAHVGPSRDEDEP